MRVSVARGASILLISASMLAIGCGGSDDDATSTPAIGGDYGPFFGVAPSETPNETDFARMAAGGIGSYHLLLSWQVVEATKGTYDWTSYDSVFSQLATHGIEPVPYVIGTPTAYAASSSESPTKDDETFDAWADFLKAAAERYGPGGDYWQQLTEIDPGIVPQPIGTWEIWNEPNSSLFWLPQPDPDAYAELIKRSSRVIKGIDPDARVMTAGMFITPQSEGAINSIDYLREVFDHQGVAEAVDVVGVHPYGPAVTDVVDQVDKTRALIDEIGDDASLWVTEIGWGSDPTSTNQLAKTPEEQAELLADSLGTLLERREELSLEGIIWFTWRDVDTGGDCGWCATAGLVDGDRGSKPAWLAFTDLTGGTP